MKRNRLLVPVVIAALTTAILASTGLSRARAGAVCTWGGTELNPTGTFQVSPGVHTAPTGVPVHFTVQGKLAGSSPRCTGNMTLDGFIVPGSSCLATIGYATVGGVPGVASDTNAGATFYVRGNLFDAAGHVVGSYDDSILSSGALSATKQCNSVAGFTGGRHWAVVTLYPVAA